MTELPFMASGIIVKNYRMLIEYFNELKRMGIDPRDSYPRSEDLELVKNLASHNKNLYDLLNELKDRIRKRVVVEAAIKAYRASTGVEPTPSEAVDEVAKLIAGWVIEIAANLGIIKLKNIEYLR